MPHLWLVCLQKQHEAEPSGASMRMTARLVLFSEANTAKRSEASMCTLKLSRTRRDFTLFIYGNTIFFIHVLISSPSILSFLCTVTTKPSSRISFSSLFPLKIIIGGSMLPAAVHVSTTVKWRFVAGVPRWLVVCPSWIVSYLEWGQSTWASHPCQGSSQKDNNRFCTVLTLALGIASVWPPNQLGAFTKWVFWHRVSSCASA